MPQSSRGGRPRRGKPGTSSVSDNEASSAQGESDNDSRPCRTSASPTPAQPPQPPKRHTRKNSRTQRASSPSTPPPETCPPSPEHLPDNLRPVTPTPQTPPSTATCQPGLSDQNVNPVHNKPQALVDRLKSLGSTPPTKKASSTMSYAQHQPFKEIRREEARTELSGHVVGPMPPNTFLEDFLPKDQTSTDRRTPNTPANLFEEMSSATREDEMYGPWIEALKPYCGDRILQVDSHTQKVFDQDGNAFGPDITTYFDVKEEDLPEKCSLALADMLLEFKFNPSDDPFNDDDDPNFEGTTESAKQTLGQITVYATAQLARQFRTHIFSMLVFPTYARLLRWDRSGVTATGKIDLSSTNIIPKFFFRLQHASPELRGVDTSVKPARLTKTEDQEVRTALNAPDDVELLEVTMDSRKFILANPLFFGASSPLGRATRCYRAYDRKTKKCYILKDTWRIFTPLRKTEHQIYEKLRRRGVPHLPKVEIGRDVDPRGKTHQTITHVYAGRRWSKTRFQLRTFRHYRIVLQELDGHLSSCRNVRDMVKALRDVAETETQAAEEGKVVHRDVSYANVMIKYDEDGNIEGFLIDWDMCKELDVEYDERDETAERTGTWYFIAARLIRKGIHPPPVQNRIDDVESLFHLLIYMAVLFTDHDFGSSIELRKFVDSYFSEVYLENDRYWGGQGKIQFFKLFTLEEPEIFETLKSHDLRMLIHDLVPPLATRYVKRKQTPARDKDGKKFLRVEQLPAEHLGHMKHLEDPNWFVNTLNEYLTKEDGDLDDKLVAQTIPPRTDTRATNPNSIPVGSLKHASAGLAILISSGFSTKRKEAPEREPEKDAAKPGVRGEPKRKRRKVNRD